MGLFCVNSKARFLNVLTSLVIERLWINGERVGRCRHGPALPAVSTVPVNSLVEPSKSDVSHRYIIENQLNLNRS